MRLFRLDFVMCESEHPVGEGALEANGLASINLFLFVQGFDLERGEPLGLEGRCSLRSFIVAFDLNLDFLVNLALNLESLD